MSFVKKVLFSLLLFVPLLVHAQAGIENYYINAVLQENGDLTVEEYFYLNGTFNGMERIILFKNDQAYEFRPELEYYGGSSIHNGSDLILEEIRAVPIDENFDFGVLDKADYVIDCIDDINAKVLIAKETFKRSIPLISSLGMGNRVDPSKVEITKLNKTTNDPLAKKFRYLLRKENIDLSKIDVAFSSETPIIKDKIISSVVFVPNSAGLNIASFVIRRIIGW